MGRHKTTMGNNTAAAKLRDAEAGRRRQDGPCRISGSPGHVFLCLRHGHGKQKTRKDAAQRWEQRTSRFRNAFAVGLLRVHVQLGAAVERGQEKKERTTIRQNESHGRALVPLHVRPRSMRAFDICYKWKAPVVCVHGTDKEMQSRKSNVLDLPCCSATFQQPKRRALSRKRNGRKRLLKPNGRQREAVQRKKKKIQKMRSFLGRAKETWRNGDWEAKKKRIKTTVHRE